MGNSGFYLYNTENCVFADNIKVGQMTEPLKDQQIILGTTSTPVAAKMTASDGISLTVSNNSSTNASITIGLDAEKAYQLILEKLGDQILDGIADTIVDNTVQDILDKIKTDPSLGLLKAFNNFPITNKIQCNGLFTPSSIETLLGGTEIGKFTVTPKSSGSMFLVSADIIASRMEGGVVLALVREGDSKPCAISYGYSSGVPNLCSLRTSITNTGLTPTTYSLRVGGLESGVVWVNALSNGNDILGITNTSNVSFLEVIPQTNA
ncbi:virulence factor Pgp3 [Chlamydia trachomatis]|uniref:Virulence plasmid protein pGP3-D n=3 Tax=Chlamydia trachomatis TaxID=813 RepID=E6YD16_CHLT4|nr:virulence factor Pgp3 [Chlamydia trachomatis]AAX51165.1 virulence plasmid protein pGP3-D [Chlamydia trachomatis A/HAR-13]AEP35788.1 Virulence plasmid protein pGP3-D [Chlamydia trachomatis A2497]AHC17768.1 virulence factor [Chlamydia trachomatis C/TW-3]AOQ16169.1 virulence factor [Chlamydia trachomatis]AOQ17076.1 virulence factor [Chlamydia trachomatis]